MKKQPTPRNIGKYRISTILGEGSMGIVYKGYDHRIDREVAIKTIHYNLLAGSKKDEYLQRFRTEAQAAARCLHNNILTVFDYGEDTDTPYIVMEYYDGTDLKNYLKNHNISITDALKITRRLLDGLQYAHLRGIVHRDLKPANIFIRNGQNIKISDFGVAKLGQSDITQTGKTVGTLRYMAPEMLNGLNVDHRADLYSVGIILYELLILSGSQAITHERRKLRVDLKNKNISSIPVSCQNIIRKALAIDPANRYQTAASFALDLQKLLRLDNFINDGNDNHYQEREALTEIQDTTESLDNISTLVMSENKEKPGQQWDRTFLTCLERNLTFYIGPFAHVLISKYVNTIRDENILVEKLAAHVHSHHDRYNFIASITKPRPSPLHSSRRQATSSIRNNSVNNSDREPAFSNDNLKSIESRLAYFIGPLANTIIKKVSTTVASEEDLYQRLAQFIPTEHEKAEFLSTQKQRMSL